MLGASCAGPGELHNNTKGFSFTFFKLEALCTVLYLNIPYTILADMLNLSAPVPLIADGK